MITAADLILGMPDGMVDSPGEYHRYIMCEVPGARGIHGMLERIGDGPFRITRIPIMLPGPQPDSFPTVEAALEWMAEQVSLVVAARDRLAGEAGR